MLLHCVKHHFSKGAVCLFLILIISSCSKDLDKQNQTQHITVAQYIDTPRPIGFQLDSKIQEESVDVLNYKGSLPVTKTMLFYRHEMERYGWSYIDFSTQNQGVLVCNKISKHCVITISQHQKTTYIQIRIKYNTPLDGQLRSKEK